METSVRTQTKTSISRKGDKIIIKEVETTTTTKKGAPPEVKVVERVKEYDVNNLPDNIKSQVGDLALPQDDKNAKRKVSSQGWQQRPSVCTTESFEKVLAALPPATQTNQSDLEKLNDESISSHNEYRQKHGVPPLTFSKKLADYAQNWAEHLAKNQKFEHRKEDYVGENLYMFYSSNPDIIATASDACKSWYSEIEFYTFGKEPKTMKSGHFTQMIWKETRRVGMGRARGPTGKQIIVANYDPPGNLIGTFVENVPQPLK